MPGNDDLFKGMKMFSEGLSSLAQSMATSDARKDVEAIQLMHNAKEIDDKEARAYGQQVGEGLALRLKGAGAKAEDIQAATAGLVPSASLTAQNQNSKEMQQAGFAQQTAEKGMDRDLAIELQQMKLDALGLKTAKQEKESYTKFAQTFRKENKDMLDSRDKVQSLNAILQKTPDRVGVEMAKTGLLKFAGEDRVSDADVIRAQRDPSMRAGIARKLELELSGEALKDDRKFYQAILSHADSLINENISKKISGYSAGLAELAGTDAAKLESGLRKQLQLEKPAEAPAPKVVKSKMYYPKVNKTVVTYSDGTQEAFDGSK